VGEFYNTGRGGGRGAVGGRQPVESMVVEQLEEEEENVKKMAASGGRCTSRVRACNAPAAWRTPSLCVTFVLHMPA
jgi:hypothetical protein